MSLEGKHFSKMRKNLCINNDELICHYSESEEGEDVGEKFDDYLNASRIKIKDKSDQAITEKVMSPHVREMLLRMINNGYLNEVSGCISTGKEANVYYATSKVDHECAIKIYKTEILDYKNRSRYIEGEHRYKAYKCSKNPRKMVRKWAEKEYRNLTRLYEDGIPCPKPYKLTHNLMIMQFLGEDRQPYPLLKDAKLTSTQLREIYKQLIIIMRNMYIKSNLVHADLSEYNILYNSNPMPHGQIYIIDVSQSIQTDSINALVFLRYDITHVTTFFQKNNLEVPSDMELFQFITNKNIVESNFDKIITEMFQQIPNNSIEKEIQQNVFKTVHIPQSLNELNYYNDTEDFYYDCLNESGTSDTNSDDSSTGTSGGSIYDVEKQEKQQEEEESASEDVVTILKKEDAIPKEEVKAMRKANKKMVKEQKKEKRKTKIPKHIKKALEKKLLRK